MIQNRPPWTEAAGSLTMSVQSWPGPNFMIVRKESASPKTSETNGSVFVS